MLGPNGSSVRYRGPNEIGEPEDGLKHWLNILTKSDLSDIFLTKAIGLSVGPKVDQYRLWQLQNG